MGSLWSAVNRGKVTLISIVGAAPATLGLTLPLAAFAQQAWPTRSIKLVVPQAPGSGSDVISRILGDQLPQYLKQSIVIENNPAANGLVAMGAIAKAPPDGYTFIMAGVSTMAFNPALYKDLPYNPAKDFTYVAPVVDTPFVLLTSNRSGIKTLAQFIEQARTKPGGLSYSSAGLGNSTHIAIEMIASIAGVKLLHVPYKGSAGALTAVLSGEVDAMASAVASALPHVQTGRANAVAVLSNTRVPQWPQVPTIKEAGLNAPDMPGWYAIVGPAGLNPSVVATFNVAMQQVMSDPGVRAKLLELSLQPIAGGEPEIRRRAASDLAVWSEFIRKNNIRIE